MNGARHEARMEIVQAANRWLVGRYSRRPSRRADGRIGASLLSQRHIHRAVRICRHNGLVDDDVLAKAGFRPSRAQVGEAVEGGLHG